MFAEVERTSPDCFSFSLCSLCVQSLMYKADHFEVCTRSDLCCFGTITTSVESAVPRNHALALCSLLCSTHSQNRQRQVLEMFLIANFVKVNVLYTLEFVLTEPVQYGHINVGVNMAVLNA